MKKKMDPQQNLMMMTGMLDALTQPQRHKLAHNFRC